MRALTNQRKDRFMADAILDAHAARCTKCGITKEITEFQKRKDRSCGHRRECKRCVMEYTKTWRVGKEELIRGYSLSYWERHPERRYAYAKDPSLKEARREYQKKYYEKNRAAIIQKVLERLKNNPSKDAARSQFRNAIKRNAIPAWANMKNIEALYQKASELTSSSGVKWHVDHIVPLKSSLVCGLHVESNLQVITATENIKKGNRRWPDMP
jgi:5-methylcytosine-specific restriction endonuclease McrA